ncbi:hypothetical protein H5410_021584 [Solanum commersonii]|uniref:Uncharacterized protein n=1 Tax=Solanum commersonii TaxID=4109 RepID=A0A9J5ZED8_SOLCO|nr:hypothetical protein H5410_021584 [Solanum commersonii]
MIPPTKEQGSKRPRSEGIPECMIVDTIPKDLWRWWKGMGNYEQKRRRPQPYASCRMMCQLARVKEVPPNDDMSRFVFDTPSGFTFDSSDILKIWFGSIISEQTEMVVDQDKGKVVHGYLSWFRDPVTFGDTPEGSNRKRKTNTP